MNKRLLTDLAIEKIKNTGIKEEIINEGRAQVIIVNIGKEEDLKEGIYITISFNHLYKSLDKVINKYLNKMFRLNKISKKNSCLIIGLGNEEVLADALGPITVKKCNIEGSREVYSFNPNVLGNTGIESTELIKAVVDRIKPDFIIVIDALLASSSERLLKTIQITNTGITPGSGVGEHKMEISESSMGIPVIAIGIPTVLNAGTIVNDTLDYIRQNKELSFLIKDSEDIEKCDLHNLIYLVMEHINLDLIVTPKQIDEAVKQASQLLSKAIDKTLHD